MKDRNAHFYACLLLLVALNFSACGGGDAGKGSNSSRNNPGSKTATPTPTPNPTSDGSGPGANLEVKEPQIGMIRDSMQSGDLTLSTEQGASLGQRTTTSTDGSMKLTVEGFKGFQSSR